MLRAEVEAKDGACCMSGGSEKEKGEAEEEGQGGESACAPSARWEHSVVEQWGGWQASERRSTPLGKKMGEEQEWMTRRGQTGGWL